MTLVEAIKSGKRFRRKGWAAWFNGNESIMGYSYGLALGEKTDVCVTGIFIKTEDVLAEDWEIDPPMRIEITREQLEEAMSEIGVFSSTDAPARLTRRLGFK